MYPHVCCNCWCAFVEIRRSVRYSGHYSEMFCWSKTPLLEVPRPNSMPCLTVSTTRQREDADSGPQMNMDPSLYPHSVGFEVFEANWELFIHNFRGLGTSDSDLAAGAQPQASLGHPLLIVSYLLYAIYNACDFILFYFIVPLEESIARSP